jgi:hypothetical protein
MRINAEAGAFLDVLFGPEGGGSVQRPWKVLAWAETASGPAFWAVTRRAWSTFDRIPHPDFAAMFARFAEHAPPKPRLPERVTIYRGQSATAPKGLSWTLDRSVAEGFARGHRNVRVPDPVVLEMEVTLAQVAFFTNDRKEREVVLMGIPV